jgi:hypothetical protein
MEQMDPGTFDSFEPVLHEVAGMDVPWQGILLGLDKLPMRDLMALMV